MQHGEDRLVAPLRRSIPRCSPATIFLVQFCPSRKKYSHNFLVPTFACQHERRATLCGLRMRDTTQHTRNMFLLE